MSSLEYPNYSRNSNSSKSPKPDELREAILANLKHAYFNAKTDTVALQNGVIPNQNHALGILNNKADDLMLLINQYGDLREHVGRLGMLDELEKSIYGNKMVSAVIAEEYREITVPAKEHADRGPGFTHHDQDSCGV